MTYNVNVTTDLAQLFQFASNNGIHISNNYGTTFNNGSLLSTTNTGNAFAPLPFEAIQNNELPDDVEIQDFSKNVSSTHNSRKRKRGHDVGDIENAKLVVYSEKAMTQFIHRVLKLGFSFYNKNKLCNYG